MNRNSALLIGTLMAGLLIASLFFGRANEMKPRAEGDPTVGVISKNLSAEEEKKLLAQANEGNVDAVVRLANFYDFVKLDSEKANFWLKKAAVHGHVRSQYNLGIKLVARKDEASRNEGIYWLKEADKSGEPLAKSALSDFVENK